MEDTTKTNPEGGTDFDGLQNFLVTVDVDGVDDPQTEEEIEIKTEVEKPKETTTEETPKEEVEQESQEEEAKVNQTDSYYGKLASKFLEKGKWQDAEIEIAEGKVVKLSELDEIDEETFFAIEESQSKFNEEEIKNNYISKKGIDENRLKIIEILKEGGDLKEIFASPEEMKRPFEDVDLDNEGIQQNVFYNYLTKVQQIKDEDAKVLLGNYQKRGELEDKVKEIVGKYQAEYDKNLEEKLNSIKLEKAERSKKDKEFTKSLEEIYQQYELDSKIAKKFSTLGTKRNQDGEYELDSIYAEKLEKPEEAADLIFFLTDKEGYLKSKMASTRIETQKEQLRRINILKDKNKKGEETKPVDESLSEFIIKV